MSLLDALDPVTRLFRERTRRSFVTEGRAHVELGDIGHDELPRFDRALRALAMSDGKVSRLELNVYARRAIFVFERGACTLAELVAWVEEAERAAGIPKARFQGAPEHPADVEPALRGLVGLAADTAAFFTGLGLSVTPLPAFPFAGTAGAVLSLVASVERLRAGLEQRLEWPSSPRWHKGR